MIKITNYTLTNRKSHAWFRLVSVSPLEMFYWMTIAVADIFFCEMNLGKLQTKKSRLWLDSNEHLLYTWPLFSSSWHARNGQYCHMLHRIIHDLTTLTLYHNDTSDCMQCVHTDVFIKTYCVMALYKCQWGYAVWCVWLHQGYFRRYIRGAHWLHGDKWPKLYHLLDFCCFSCVMSSLDIILNC